MPRAARQAATEALSRLGQSSAPDLGSDDDGETESDDGEEAQEEQQQLATEPLPLTEYELQRQRNIAANQSVLESLGLAGKTPLGAAACRRRNGRSSAAAAARRRGRRRWQVANSRGAGSMPTRTTNPRAERDGDDDDDDDDDGRSGASTASTTPSIAARGGLGLLTLRRRSSWTTRSRRAAARFRWLRGESAGATAAGRLAAGTRLSWRKRYLRSGSTWASAVSDAPASTAAAAARG